MEDTRTQTVRVENVSTKVGKNAQGKSWTKYELEANDGRFKAGTFNKKIGAFLQENLGERVTVEVTQSENGRFLNLVSAVEAAPEEVKSQVTKSTKSFYQSDPGKEVRIVREVALKAAVEFLSGTSDASVGTVLHVSKQFEKYINGEATDVEPGQSLDEDEEEGLLLK